jgi:hypothetical protein
LKMMKTRAKPGMTYPEATALSRREHRGSGDLG